MISLLNILNNPRPSGACGGSSCGTGSCGSGSPCGSGPQGPGDNSRRAFLQRATSMMLGSFSLTLLPMFPQDQAGHANGESAVDSAAAGGHEPATAESLRPVLYGFLVDTEKCVGAGKCLTACRVENKVPEGYSRTWVERFVHLKDGTVQVDLVPESGYYGSAVPDIDPELVDKAYFVPKLDQEPRGDRTGRRGSLHRMWILCSGVSIRRAVYQSGNQQRGQMHVVLSSHHQQ